MVPQADAVRGAAELRHLVVDRERVQGGRLVSGHERQSVERLVEGCELAVAFTFPRGSTCCDCFDIEFETKK